MSVCWLPYAVEGFFSNGGKRAYIVRVACEGKKNGCEKEKIAKKASGFIPDISGKTTTIDGDQTAGNVFLQVADTTDLKEGDTLLLRDEAFTEYVKLKYAGVFKFLTLYAGLANNYPAGEGITKMTKGNTYPVANEVDAGVKEIVLEGDISELAVADIILIDEEENAEFGSIGSITDSTITLVSDLKYGHESGSQIRKLTSTAASPMASVIIPPQEKDSDLYVIESNGGFTENDAIKLGDEYFLIKAVEEGNLILKEKLRYGHKDKCEIKKLVETINVEASSEGKWGNGIKLRVKENPLCKTSLADLALNTDTFMLKTVNGIEKGTILKIEPEGDSPIYETVKEVFKEERKIILENVIAKELSADTVVSTVEFDLIVRLNDSEEIFKNLSMNKTHSRYVEKVITEKTSRMVRITKVNDIDGSPQPMPTPDKEPGWLLRSGENSGEDGIPAEKEFFNVYVGVDDDKVPENRTGLYALKNKEDIRIVAIPGVSTQEVQDKIIEHCEGMNRFAVLDSVEAAELDDVEEQRDFFDSKYAALYYPWICTFDPVSKTRINVPPSGHVCGIYARSDVERGVHKAPANEKINGVLGLEEINGNPKVLTKGQQEILNPKGINCIRVFPGRGVRVWGARTLSSDSLWKFINVRRLFIYIEESIEEGTQWVVFEPNNERLWARVRATITQFLTGVWRDGALMGTKPEEAFFVKCDRTTMTQDDIDNGRLICVIGIAPVKPAEFVIFRIAQWQGGSAATE